MSVQKDHRRQQILSLIFITALTTIIKPILSATVDLTIQDRSIGEDVVDSTLAKIRLSKIFPQDDFDFLKRLAYFESVYGTGVNTFRANFYGGIWQVPESIYTTTKNTATYPALLPYIQNINTSFKIQWQTTTWNNLLKPLYSALAIRLYLRTVPQSIPQTLSNQAQFWVTYLRQPGDTRTREQFINTITLYESQKGTCSGRMDLLIVCDGSGSIGSTDFAKALNFIWNLVGPYSVETVRVGLIIFSDVSTIVFPLNHTLNSQEIMNTILKFPYPGGNTYTNEALSKAVSVFQGTKIRTGIPRILAVLTDGKSTGSDVSNIQLVKNLKISSFAVGIGQEIDNDELQLLAQSQSSRVFKLDDYDSLVEFYKRLNRETCTVPQTPGLNVITKDVLIGEEKRYYSFPLNDQGSVAVVLGDEDGKVRGYYSYMVDTPNSALNDGTFITGDDASGSGRIVIDGNGMENDGQVYVAIQGVDGVNEYMIVAYNPSDCYSNAMMG